jgi:hypothetical protein
MDIFQGNNLINIFDFGDIERLTELLDNGLDPNYTRTEIGIGIDVSLLRLAVSFNKPKMVSLLLERGADINSLDAYDGNLLYLAGMRKYYDIMGILISNNINYNNVDRFGLTAFDNIILIGHDECLIFCIEMIGIDKIKISEKIFEEFVSNKSTSLDSQIKITQKLNCLRILEAYNKLDLLSIDKLKLAISKGLYNLVELILSFNPRIERQEKYLVKYTNERKIATDNKNIIKNKLKEFYETKTSKAESIFTNILFKYKDELPNEIKNNIVSFLY